MALILSASAVVEYKSPRKEIITYLKSISPPLLNPMVAHYIIDAQLHKVPNAQTMMRLEGMSTYDSNNLQKWYSILYNALLLML